MTNKTTKLTDLSILDAIERKDLFAPSFKKAVFSDQRHLGPLVLIFESTVRP